MKQKTFIVIGCARGGTTMVAQMLQTAGVFIGNNLPTNLEDVDFRIQSLPKIKQLIDLRNKEFDVWGWKYPGMSDMPFAEILSIINYCRNPHVIIVTRDVNAIALSAHRRGGQPYRRFINAAHRVYTNILPLINKTNCMIISYEHALTRPKEVAEEFINFTGSDISLEKLIENMNPIKNKFTYGY